MYGSNEPGPPDPTGPPGGYHSAPPPGPYGPSPYDQPTTYGMPWPPPGVAVPPPRKRLGGGAITAIVAAVLVPVLAVCGTLGYFFVRGVQAGIEAASSPSPTASPTPDVTAVPVVGVCYRGEPTDRGWNDQADTNTVVDCERPHVLETIAAGAVLDAGRNPPELTSPAAAELYETCADAADSYLGLPWITTRTWVVLSVPTRSAWRLGAHWYRCDLAGNDGVNDMDTTRTSGPLREQAALLDCVTWEVVDDGAYWRRPAPSECTEPHNGEVAGGGRMPTDLDWDDEDSVSQRLAEQCEPIVLGFLDRPSVQSALDWWTYYPFVTQAEGRLDQYVLCVISARDLDRTFTASLKGIGSGTIPFAG